MTIIDGDEAFEVTWFRPTRPTDGNTIYVRPDAATCDDLHMSAHDTANVERPEG